MTEREKDSGASEPQFSILSVSRQWWHICVILLCVETLGWMAFIWSGARGDAEDYRELAEIVVYGASRAVPLFIVLSIAVALFAEFTGGVIVVLAKYLKHKFEKQAEERGMQQGIQRGKQQANANWESWYRRMEEARKQDEPFDEPPPSMKN